MEFVISISVRNSTRKTMLDEYTIYWHLVTHSPHLSAKDSKRSSSSGQNDANSLQKAA